MRVKLWGVRGSCPVSFEPALLKQRLQNLLKEFKGSSDTNVETFLSQLPQWQVGGFGGNTSCIEVYDEDSKFVIDAGTGIRSIGDNYLKGPCGKGQGQSHIFFTHFHWDHTLGLPFFTPLYIPGNEIHLYSVQPELEDMVRTIFKKPFFPVSFEDLGAKIHFHYLKPRESFNCNGFEIIPYLLDHPDPCWGYKISKNGRTLSYCTDTECKRRTPEELGEDLPLYQDINLLIFDGQYTMSEYPSKMNWGHSVASMGLEIAMREKVEKMLFVHHDPSASDEKIQNVQIEAQKFYVNKLKSANDVHELEWSFAHDGMDLKV